MIPARLPPMLFDREPNSMAFPAAPPGPWFVVAGQVFVAGSVTGEAYVAGAATGEAFVAGTVIGEVS